MILYISGPMTGIEDYNYPAFHEVKESLLEAGHQVISPADLPDMDEWVDYMEANILDVFRADGLALLSGWENSKGARIEFRIAECRGIEAKPWADWI